MGCYPCSDAPFSTPPTNRICTSSRDTTVNRSAMGNVKVVLVLGEVQPLLPQEAPQFFPFALLGLAALDGFLRLFPALFQEEDLGADPAVGGYPQELSLGGAYALST